MEINLFSKYRENKFESVHKDGTLFELDLTISVKGTCPYCFRRLYEMRDKPFFYCRNKTHKRFLISKDKVYPS